MKDKIKRLLNVAIVQCIIIAVILDFVLEILGRHSVVNTIRYIGTHPLIFLYNCSIIFFTLTIALLMRKRIFGYCLVSFAWLLCGVTNCIVLGFRITPFSAIDMLMARNTITIIDKYFNAWQLVLIGIGLFLALAAIIILFLKSPTIHGNLYRIRTTVLIVSMFCLVMLFTKIALNAQAISDNFSNLATAYEKYGFVYCFSNSVVDVGIGEPDGYSEEKMQEIKKSLDEVETKETALGKKKPNVVVVQLESFMDPSYVKGLEFSENPIPTFTKLKEECTSGFLTMPAIGAGTANSEFEVLSGFNVAYFGAGEYPYKTVLGSTTCETMATQLSLMDYATHAIHNHDGTFYDRYEVYKNLGFDTFTPMEYMYNINLTQKNWEKDDVLTGEIMKALNSTKERDFVFTVSVQGHGRYPNELDLEHFSYPIQVSGTGDELLDVEWTYYCNQLHEMDAFIADLIDTLSNYDEEVVLVMYGDHLPGFELTEDSVENGDLYQTEYFIWSNTKNFPVRDEDIYAYQLSTKLFQTLGYKMNYMQKFNALYKPEDENFDEIMCDLEYDMLYGERYIYPDGWPYEPTDMTYGIDVISIKNIRAGSYEKQPENPGKGSVKILEGYYIEGENFNKFSYAWVDDKYIKDTIYIDKNTLFVEDDAFDNGDEVRIAQVGDDNIQIGYSEPFHFEEAPEPEQQ